MVKKLFLGGMCGFLAVGCGAGAPSGESGTPVATSEEALTATAATGSVYRLNSATFEVFDHSGNRVAVVNPTSADTTINIPLKPGNYTIVLDAGWVLQRQIDNGWVDMVGSLTAQPIGQWWINPGQTTPLLYQFSASFTTGTVTDTSPPYFQDDPNPGAFGTAVISMDVDDCALYASKISALASFTIDCLGTLDGTQYSKSGGALVRNFTSCSTGNTTALASIDGILSLQYDRPDLVTKYPKAGRDVQINKSYSSQCIAGAYDKWHTAFVASGPNVCPTWQVASQQNGPQTGTTAVVTAGLPGYTTDKKTKLTTTTYTTPSLVEMEKLGITYNVAFPPSSPTPNCGTAAQCAAACAGGFRGFVLSTPSDTQITADPAYWELPNVYSAATNPFLANGYYHAMADYGPVPGDQFGHAQRSLAIQDTKGNWTGEACTYYLNGTRFWTKLIYNQNTTGAVSWCKPPQ
jgi:hypothetical protein